MKLEVKETEGKWGLFYGNSVLGVSKARYDADFAYNILQKLLKEAYEDSYNDGAIDNQDC